MSPIEKERTLPARSLQFWFDYTCPFAYLGSTQAPALAERMGVALEYCPLLLGGVFRAVNTPQNLFATRSAARSAHEGADMHRWASKFDVPLRMPPEHPMRSVEALRATIVTKNDPKVIAGFYRAYWADNLPISSPDVIRDVVSKAGHDAGRVQMEIESQAVKDDLRARTDRGIALGIFGVPAWLVDGEHLYWGQDRITLVEGVRKPIEPKHARSPRKLRKLEAYWDFSSPFAYLAMTQVDAIVKRTGALFDSYPILLGGLFRSIGTPDVPLATFSEAKQRHTLKDIHRWAEYLGIPFKFPSNFPTNSLKALRLYYALPEERRTQFRDATFKAYWAEDRDIANEEVLAACVGDEAIAKDAIAKMGSDEVKAALRASTDRAAAKNVFGAPTFIVGDNLYWGQDRLDFVESALLS